MSRDLFRVTNGISELTDTERCSTTHTARNSTCRTMRSGKTKYVFLTSKVITMPTKKLTTLVVDDEPLARERLAGLARGGIGCRGASAQCRDGEEAVSAIHERHARPGAPRRRDAEDERLPGDRRGRSRPDAAGHLRHRVRSARAPARSRSARSTICSSRSTASASPTRCSGRASRSSARRTATSDAGCSPS